MESLKKREIRHSIEINNGCLQIIVGAGSTKYQNWIPTDYPYFDITKETHRKYYFRKNNPDKLLAEHVPEHFAENQIDFNNEDGYIERSKKSNFPDKNIPNYASLIVDLIKKLN